MSLLRMLSKSSEGRARAAAGDFRVNWGACWEGSVGPAALLDGFGRGGATFGNGGGDDRRGSAWDRYRSTGNGTTIELHGADDVPAGVVTAEPC